MFFEGIMTAIATPIDENGAVLEKEFRELIRFQYDNGVKGILVLGGSGEGVQLSAGERHRVMDIAVDEGRGHLQVVAGIILPGLQDVLEDARYAKACGADAVMVVTPYYVVPSQEGFLEYYLKVSEAAQHMPLYIYNIPYRTGVNILPATVEKIADRLPNLVGIKECTQNLGQFIDLAIRVGNRISVLSGEEFLCVSELALGACGAVMATANIIPGVWVRIYELSKEKNYDEAVSLLKKYYPYLRACFLEANPGPLKAAMRLCGLPAGCTSLPLLEPSAENMRILADEAEKLGLVKH